MRQSPSPSNSSGCHLSLSTPVAQSFVSRAATSRDIHAPAPHGNVTHMGAIRTEGCMVSPLRRSAGKNGTRALRDAVGCRPVTNAPTTDAGRRSQAAYIPDQRSVQPAVLVLRLLQIRAMGCGTSCPLPACLIFVVAFLQRSRGPRRSAKCVRMGRWRLGAKRITRRRQCRESIMS